MNLRAIANSLTRGINPNNTTAILAKNDGYTVAAGGIKTPKYIESTIEIQTQSIESKDLQHLNLTAQQGQYNFVYANGLISAQRRNLDKGEDLLKFKSYGENEVSTWKVTKVMESYPDWVKVLVHRVTL